MEITLRSRAMLVLGVVGFGVAMTVRDGLTSIYMRVLLVVAAGGFQSVSFLYAFRQGASQTSLRQKAMIVLGVIGFAVAMTARDELSSIYTRTLLGGVAGAFMGVALVHAYQRPDRQ